MATVAALDEAPCTRAVQGSAEVRDSRRLETWAYVALALGLVLYILAIWLQVYIDTRKLASPLPDHCAESHRRWRLRTAFVFLIWSVLGGFTLPFGIGWPVLIAAYVWYVYRVVRGGIGFARRRPVGLMRPRRGDHSGAGNQV
ncbi:MAG TPA: hypothetical protein VF292_09530 [Rhodanobacteraceae bacterium]